MTVRDYSGDGITVHWNSELCQHSRRCFTGLPRVFDPQERPWVHPDAATADEVAAQIELCPSGALRYTRVAPAGPAA